jgi:hypothetical protein
MIVCFILDYLIAVAIRKQIGKLQFIFTARWLQYLLKYWNISVDDEVEAVFSVGGE